MVPHRTYLFTLILAAALCLAPATAHATTITCRTGAGCLNGTDYFDWGVNFGAELSSITSGSTITSNGGITATLLLTGGNGMRLDQGTTAHGDFSAGDKLAFTDANGPLSFVFATPVSSLGANIQADYYGDFTASLVVYDAFDIQLGSFLLDGNSGNNGDGSAIFIGLSDIPGIAKATFSLTKAFGNTYNDFAINQLDFTTAAVPAPEPASFALVATGLAAVVFGLRRRSA